MIYELYIKMSENINQTYYQKNRDVKLNRAKDYYKNDKERLREENMEKIDISICLKTRKKD